MSIDLSSIQNLGISVQDGSNSGRTISNNLEQQDFLELMMTQLNNQDPMNPMESTDFLGQIAQMSTVTGIENLNSSFASLSSSLTSDQSLQAANLVGRNVLVSSGEGVLAAGGSLDGQITLDRAASVEMNIYDTSGELLKTVDLGDQSAGQVAFSWNGMMDDGTYANPGSYIISAVATDSSGTSSVVETQVRAAVDSVTLGQGADGLAVNLSGLGKVSFDDIKQIL